jgi:hypothetical protein
MKEPDAVLHQVASVCFELPGLDSNQDKESQNPHMPRRKPKPHKTVTPSADSGCSAGCSDQRSEGGIPDADLAALVAAWPTLPDPIKAAIRALVGTVAPTPTPPSRVLPNRKAGSR